MKERELYRQVWKELSGFKEMIFMTGPRQAGKTTLAEQIAEDYPNHVYFNYDLIENRRLLLEKPRFYEEINLKDAGIPLVVLDEIHKHHDGKNYLKSVYDRDHSRYKFLVSGSGRLDVYQKGSDSLAGRYLLFHLWPFTLAELAGKRRRIESFLEAPLEVSAPPGHGMRQAWDALAKFSGFPEPFLKGNSQFYNLWSRNYRRQILREDIRSHLAVQKADQMELLMSLLPSRVGSPIAMDNLARDIGVSFDSVKSWLEVFEDFFLTFRISPWTRRISRSIMKEKKTYLWDYAGIESPGALFENMVAVELFRAVSGWTDLGKGEFSLHYVRTKDKEEVDFLVAEGNRPLFIVETKAGEDEVPRSLRKIQGMLNIPAIQLVNRSDVHKRLSNGSSEILVVSAARWLAGLP